MNHRENNITTFKIDPDRSVEEAIYYTLGAHNIYVQVAFPENTQYYGNVLIYQLHVRENPEFWIFRLGAQTNQPQQVKNTIIKTLTTKHIKYTIFTRS